MSNFMRRCHVAEMIKKTQKTSVKNTGKCFFQKRNLITQEATPGVYSFGPDLNLYNGNDNDVSEGENGVFKGLKTEMPANPYYERPVPIIFVSGEALSADIWFSTANYFLLRGYSGILISLPDDSNMKNIDSATDYLERKRSDFGLTPPIMVAHSISSFIAQKYLESYSLKGLVLINPVPPEHYETVGNMLNRQKECDKNVGNTETGGKPLNENQDNQLLSPFSTAYYNIENPIDLNFGSHIHPSSSFPIHFMEHLYADKAAALRLEKGVVPMLVVSTEGDKIENHSTPILTEISLNSISDFHGFDKKSSVVSLKCHSRAPMLASESAGELNQIIYDWIDDL